MGGRPIPEGSIIFSARTPKAGSRMNSLPKLHFPRQTASRCRPAELPRLSRILSTRVVFQCVSIGTGKFFEVLIHESLRDNVQKAGDLPIVTDVGEVIAGSGYAGWFVRKGFRELPVRS